MAAIGSLMGLGLAAGVRLYATILAVGLGIRFGFFQLHPALTDLEVLANKWVLMAAGAAYLLEFFADKIPWVDSLWDGIHTAIRPIGAALIGSSALGQVDPSTKILAGLLAGGVALTSHSAKAGTRLVVNHSPEPFSNIILSLVEDVFVVGGAWLAMAHPLVMIGVVATFLALFAWLSPKVIRLLTLEWTAVSTRLFPPADHAVMPEKYGSRAGSCRIVLRAAAGRGVPGLKNSVGWLCATDNNLVFVARRNFRVRRHHVPFASIKDVQFQTRILLNQVRVTSEGGTFTFDVFKERSGATLELVELLRRAGGMVTVRADQSSPAVRSNPEPHHA